MLFPSFFSTSALLVIFSLYCWSSSYLVQAQQNAKEEAICSRFLTSPKSTPLIEDLPRDLKYDEDAEFSCELVLQDRFLPPQIRLTIHEGLYYLQQRHLALGVDKEAEAARHSTVLAEILPNAFKFRYFAGLWQLSPKISRPDLAVTHLHQCLYGKAAKDIDETVTEDLRYQTRLLYIKALGELGRMDEVKTELMFVLQNYPLDFRSQFLLEELLSSNSTAGTGSDTATTAVSMSGNKDEVEDNTASTLTYTHVLEEMIAEVTKTHKEVFQRYRGVLDQSSDATATKSSWEMPVLSELPTAEEFHGYIHRREPFVVSFGSTKALDEALQWKVSQWVNNVNYWKQKVDEEETLQVEGMPKSLLTGCLLFPTHTDSSVNPQESSCGQFGLHSQVRRRVMNVHEVFTNQFQDANYSYYLNIQPSYSGKGLYRSPLHFVKDDIPVQKHAFFQEIMSNMSNIQLWTGKTLQDNQATMSRLHRDATDNLYFLLQGRKQFSLWSPRDSFEMNTVSPTFGVNEDGLSYQFNINAFRTYLYYRLHQENKTLEQIFSQAHTNSEYFHLLNSITSKGVAYDTEHTHFSKLTTHKNPSEFYGEECSATKTCASSTRHGGKLLPPPAAIVEMKPGDFIYLPTGWFHQVKSYGGAHMALNYWWKPLNWNNAQDSENNMAKALFDALWDKLTGASGNAQEA